jgi:hypothetical protein
MVLMLSASESIKGARTVELVRLGQPTESGSRTGFREVERWPLEGAKAESLRRFFSSPSNFRSDDPYYLKSMVAFTESFAVRFDNLDVLLDECTMWVGFGKIDGRPRRLSIEESAKLQLAELLVDLTETHSSGCLSMRIAAAKGTTSPGLHPADGGAEHR